MSLSPCFQCFPVWAKSGSIISTELPVPVELVRFSQNSHLTTSPACPPSNKVNQWFHPERSSRHLKARYPFHILPHILDCLPAMSIHGFLGLNTLSSLLEKLFQEARSLSPRDRFHVQVSCATSTSHYHFHGLQQIRDVWRPSLTIRGSFDKKILDPIAEQWAKGQDGEVWRTVYYG